MVEWPYKLIETRVDSEQSQSGHRFEYQLFDLATDPGETMDLALQQAQTTTRLSATLRSWHRSLPRLDLPSRNSEEQLSEEEIDELRRLGYVDP